jgi:hypothetical protein
MPPREFSFGNALSHWSNTQGPGGFIWKYALAYGLATVAFLLGFILLAGGAFMQLMSLSTQAPGGQVSDAEVMRVMGTLIPIVLLAIPLAILFWVVFEGALQRRYMRDEGFSLKLGGDEGRLFVVGLLWMLTLFGLYIGIGLVVAIVGGGLTAAFGETAALVVIPLVIAGFAAFVWVIVRLSPASAMTVRDRKITFTSAFAASKGRFWSMFFAFIIMAIIVYIVSLVLQLILFGVIGGAMMTNPGFTSGSPDPEAVMAALFSPTTLVLGGVIYFVMSALQAAIQFAWAGIPALAAKTDPNWSGGQADVFS